MTNSADPDQLASPTDLDLHCLLRQGMLCSEREELKSLLGERTCMCAFHHIPLFLTGIYSNLSNKENK